MKESDIKKILLKALIETTPNIILGVEFSYDFSNRRADIISFYQNKLIAYEIKSKNDTIQRLEGQTKSYKEYFDQCYVVCEKANLSKIRSSIGSEIGILLVDKQGITKKRNSRTFLKLNKINLASTLNKEELVNVSKESRTYSKYELCTILSKKKKLSEIKQLSRDSIKRTYQLRTNTFIKELGISINSDDITTLSRRSPTKLF
jgi:hypothetical protein